MINQRPGFNWINHGSYVKLVSCIILFLITFFYLLTKLISRYCIDNIKRYKFIFIAFVMLIIYLTHLEILESKKYFNRGFNNEWLS